MQPINLDANCSTGNTMHEITHALGLWHEQSRCDRNSYVEILYANIQPAYAYNFDALCLNATDLYAYAEGSIMHYPPYAFSVNGQPTIRSLRGLDNLMGQRAGYGATDIATINQIYPASAAVWGYPRLHADRSEGTRGRHCERAVVRNRRRQWGRNCADQRPGLQRHHKHVDHKGAVARCSVAHQWLGHDQRDPVSRWGVDATSPGHTKTLYAYNSLVNSWSTKAPMPVAGGCGGSGAISGIVYVLIGCDGSTSTTSGAKGILLRYDPTANTWSTKAPSPSPHQFPAVTATGGKLYVIGGKNGSGVATNVVHVYTPSTNTWTTKAPLPAARHRSTAQVVAGKIYVFGGNDAAGNYTSTVYVYDPATNVWSTVSPMPAARANLGSGVINNVFYVVGGQGPSAAVLSTNQAFTP